MTIEEAFGAVIRELRREQGLSQETLAAESSLDRSYISLLENGHQQPSLITIMQLAKAFKVPASQIVAAVEQKLA